MVVSVTRLHLRSARYLLPFLVYTFRSTDQATRSPGFLKGSLLRQPGEVYCTVTLWDSTESMKAYRNSGFHQKAMGRIGKWCNESAVTTRDYSESDLPSWPQAWEWLKENAHFMRLPHSSKAQQERRNPEEQPHLTRSGLVPLSPGVGLADFVISPLFRVFNALALIPWLAMIFTPHAEIGPKS